MQLSILMQDIHIHFNEDSQTLLSVLLAFIMYGVSLGLKWENVKTSFARPKAITVGLLSQFIVLPFLTFILILLWQPLPGIALGLLLVAACPGGTISNFISSLSKADIGLSVSLTAVATLGCIVMTPFNFTFYSRLVPQTANLVREVSLDPIDIFSTVAIILLLPAMLGILTRNKFPKLAELIDRPIRLTSMLIFIGFVAVAFFQNLKALEAFWKIVVLIVICHNTIAITSGFLLAKMAKLPRDQQRSIAVETGIQNSGLGLVISFTFFPEMGELALVCATWGICHIISGFGWAFVLRRLPIS